MIMTKVNCDNITCMNNKKGICSRKELFMSEDYYTCCSNIDEIEGE